MRYAFTPGSPVTEHDRLVGRDTELVRCVATLQIPVHNLVIYGPRGSGKTSLARVAVSMYGQTAGQTAIAYTCAHGDTYREIFGYFLSESNQLYKSTPSLEIQNRDLHAEASIPFAKGGAKASNTKHQKLAPIWDAGVRPFELATKYLAQDRVFLIDEFDRVRDDETLTFLSDTIKALGDQGSGTKLVLVGVADTARELLGKHASVARNIRTVGLRGLDDKSIQEILIQGLDQSGLATTLDARAYVVAVTCGLPYIVHLLGSELLAIATVKGLRTLSIEHCHLATSEAIHNVFQHVRGSYEDFVFCDGTACDLFPSTRPRDSVLRELVLLAVALLAPIDISKLPDSVSDLASAIADHVRSRTQSSVHRESDVKGLRDIHIGSIDQLRPLLETSSSRPFRIDTAGRQSNVEVVDPALAALARLRLADLTSPAWLCNAANSAT